MRFDKEACSAFLDWLAQIILPSAPNETMLDGVITEWFSSNRMIRPKAKIVANLVAKAEHRFESVLFAIIAGQDDPAMLDALKGELARRWPMTSLLDVLKEVDLRIGFTKSFPTAAARQTLSSGEVSRRLLLALYGIGTNIGLKAIAAGPHNVTYKELLYIRQRFIHKNALRTATRAIADATNRVRATDIWGDGSSSCASDSTQHGPWDQNLMTE